MIWWLLLAGLAIAIWIEQQRRVPIQQMMDKVTRAFVRAQIDAQIQGTSFVAMHWDENGPVIDNWLDRCK